MLNASPQTIVLVSIQQPLLRMGGIWLILSIIGMDPFTMAGFPLNTITRNTLRNGKGGLFL